MSLTRGKSLALLIAVCAVALAAPEAMARGGGSSGGFGAGMRGGAGPHAGGFGAGGRADLPAGPSAGDPGNPAGNNKDGAVRGLERADDVAGDHGDKGRDRAETDPGATHRK